MSFFNKIINLGLNDTIPPEDASRIKALNLYGLVGSQFYILPVGLFLLYSFPIAGIGLLAFYPFYTAALLFSYLGKFSVARSLLLYTPMVHAWLFLLAATAGTMTHLWFLVFAALAFLLYPRSDKVNLYIVVVIAVLSFNFWCLFDPLLDPLQLNLTQSQIFGMRAAFAGAASIILPLLLAYFYEAQFKADQKIRVVKEQQDGDYFLTNLIMRPLFTNYNRSGNVKSEFLIHQKKKFEFKKWKGELGGDLCITGNLLFYGRKYTLFVSADAMGKSMQGAGGAIVFGTVMNNILSRSASNRRNLIMDPEVWLEQTFQELHASFVTFDGSMLNSCVVGLIEDATGKMFYFNNEHPAIVLMRDNVASFLDHSTMQKLGSPIMNRFELSHFQLFPHDILIVGSDGRDDIILNDTGTMNEDDRLFLRFVENANGSLTDILDHIQNRGSITDDFSLIRIDFLPSEANITEVELPDERHIRNLIRERKFEEVTQILDGWSIAELTHELVLFKCIALDRIGLGRGAKPILKKLLEQNPGHFDSILLLANMAFRAGEENELALLIEVAKKISPDDSRLHDLIARTLERK